ncbi:hypothetical protein VAR608DRAFT_1251 [Variovorax sp. HW608]|uniref:oxygen-binding protein n=1 Tax=Variovorax sp. HW608 TaxID=1034889 RepID=UPI00081FE588|nr:oxygen-binding protein [Variovorax sp. HW608]SCK17787.1 hypothetical protein VAR608DRAFT_1251 [Variovorax sp. HW608]
MPMHSTTRSTGHSQARARWVPCNRACYFTLHWPLADAASGRDALLPPACLPQLLQPAHRLLALCNEEGLRRLMQLHMERLRRTSLFARAGRCFDCVSQRVADFVVEACGGPLCYSERHSRLQAGAGLPLLLDEEGREIWLVQLWHAFDDAGFPPALRADFWNWAEPLSVHLLAPQARHAGLTRYDYDTVRSWFPARPASGRAAAEGAQA